MNEIVAVGWRLHSAQSRAVRPRQLIQDYNTNLVKIQGFSTQNEAVRYALARKSNSAASAKKGVRPVVHFEAPTVATTDKHKVAFFVAVLEWAPVLFVPIREQRADYLRQASETFMPSLHWGRFVDDRRASDSIPVWVSGLYVGADAESTSAQLGAIFSGFRDLARQGAWGQIDQIILAADLPKMPSDAIVGLARYSHPVKSHLKAWTGVLAKISEELKSRGKDAELLLRGLHAP